MLAGFSGTDYGNKRITMQDALAKPVTLTQISSITGKPIIVTTASQLLTELNGAKPVALSPSITDPTLILNAIQSYGKQVPQSGEHWLAQGQNPPMTTEYDYAKALFDGTITLAQLKILLGDKNSSYADTVQNQANGINKTITFFDNGMTTGTDRMGDPTYDYTLTNAQISSLTNAIRETGIPWDTSKENIFVLWESLSPDDKYQVANIYNGYVNPNSMLESTEITFQQYLANNRLSNPTDILKLPSIMVAGMGSGILTPYAKNETVGDVVKQISPYAVRSTDGKIVGYDLTQYLNDNPANSAQLATGGFKAVDITTAQSGQKVVAVPQKAGIMDWATSAVLSATVVTPLVAPFVGAAEGLISLGELGATSAIFVPQYVKSIPEMSWTERIVYGGLLATPFIGLAKDMVVYGVQKPIDLATNTYNAEDIRLQKGMPSVDVNPNISEALGIDGVKVGQGAVQDAKTDIFVADPNGNYVDRLNPLQRASNLLDTKDTYEFTSHGTAKLFTDAINQVPETEIKGTLYDKDVAIRDSTEAGEQVHQTIASDSDKVSAQNIIKNSPEGTIFEDATGLQWKLDHGFLVLQGDEGVVYSLEDPYSLQIVARSKVVEPPSYITNVPTEQVGIKNK